MAFIFGQAIFGLEGVSFENLYDGGPKGPPHQW